MFFTSLWRFLHKYCTKLDTVDYVIACVEFGQNTDYAPAPLIVFSDVATIRNLNSSL